jgi:nucleotidyltransferase substrate binding protein (TIGR01987 family)
MSETELDKANARDPLREFGHALDRLQEALGRNAEIDSLVVDASIQRFEFCVELAWKCLKKLLEAEGEEAKTPRQALQKAYAAQWIGQETIWLEMLTDRNLTSHTYREDLAREIYSRIPGYYSALRSLYQFLITRYGNPI